MVRITLLAAFLALKTIALEIKADKPGKVPALEINMVPIIEFFSEKPQDPVKVLQPDSLITDPAIFLPDLEQNHPKLQATNFTPPKVGAVGGTLLNSFDWLSFIPCETCQGMMIGLYNLIMADRNRQSAKGFLGFGCLFVHDGETCHNSIETYYMMFEFEMWNGVFGDTFFCQNILATCPSQWVKQTLADYVTTTIAAQKPPALANDDFIDIYYTTNAVTFADNTAKTNTILQMANLNVDLQYNAGADSSCREHRCCHLQGDGKLPDSLDEDNAAGPYGHSNCDMPPGGIRQFLSTLRRDQLNSIDPGIVVVNGGVVTRQPGQLSKQEIVDTITEAYTVVRQAFPTSFIFPIFGSPDMYPQYYQTFEYDSEKAVHITQQESKLFMEEVIAIFEPYLAFDDTHTTSINQYGFYHLSDVPYANSQTTDSTGASTYTPLYMPDTEFVALNTQACFVGNNALVSTYGDPGNQLTWLKDILVAARTANKVVMIAGYQIPGDLACNRQWAHRLNTLMESFQDIIRLTMYASSGVDAFQIIRSETEGNPINVASVVGGLNRYESDPSVRVINIETSSSLPVTIDVYKSTNIQDANGLDVLMEVTKAYTLPTDWGMTDLSPKSYDALITLLQADETQAVAFANKIAMNNEDIEMSSCGTRCRLYFTCDKNYADNEQIMYCQGGLVDLGFGMSYLAGAVFENPWYNFVEAGA